MELQHIIAQKKELLVRETFSRQPINYSENMAADEKDRFIQYLVDKVNMFELDKRATELAVEEFQSQFDSVSSTLDSMKKEMAILKAELHDERSKRKKAEAKANKLDQQLKLRRRTSSATNDKMLARTRRKMNPPIARTRRTGLTVLMGQYLPSLSQRIIPQASILLKKRRNVIPQNARRSMIQCRLTEIPSSIQLTTPRFLAELSNASL